MRKFLTTFLLFSAFPFFVQMKNKHIFFLLLLCTYGVPALAQYTGKVQSSLWKIDSVYKFEAKIRRYDIQFERDELIQTPRSSAFLDSLAAYLHAHPELYIEIGVHKEMGYPDWDNYITKKRSRTIIAYLNNKGIPSEQLRAKGYGFTDPLYRERDLRIAKTKRDRDSLIDFNNRVEFKVLGVNSEKQKLFSLTDTAFTPGSISRNYHFSIHGQENALSLNREDSLSLDSIIAFLKQHPSFVVEIGSYADIRQYWKAGIIYSHQNSKAICNYMMSKGIAQERLIPKGYGDSRPLHSEAAIKAVASTEEQERMHMENRRVKFSIISIR
jgi:outer membrane protein OmpA-like peptidoglycan-associated protein